LVATGDAVVNGAYNFTADGNIGNWPKVIEQVQKLKVDHVLPGHGPAGGPEVLAGQRSFFLELHKQVAAAIKAGKKQDEIAKALQLPESVKKWVGVPLSAQAGDAYREITEKKPAGDLPH
jgi:cyclase